MCPLLQQYIRVLLVLFNIAPGFLGQDLFFPSLTPGRCTTNSGQAGRCQDIKNCAPEFRNVQVGGSTTHCGFKGNRPLVCCPASVGSITGDVVGEQISELREIPTPEYTWGFTTCGLRGLIEYNDTSSTTRKERSPEPQRGPLFEISEDDNKVAGGETAIRNSWPWMVLLGRKRGPFTNFFCGGVLISDKFVITAAHCVLDFEPFFVRLGEHDYSPGVDENLYEELEDVNVTDIIFHPKNDFNHDYYDMALLRLDKTLKIRDSAAPICLPWGKLANEDLVGEEVTVTGWGNTEFDGAPSSVLQEANITVFEPAECEASYSTLRTFGSSFPRGFNRGNIVCAGDELGGKDACKGDSGGPLMNYVPEENTFYLAGIVSKGFGCGKKDFPGLYAPLRNYDTLIWIKNIVFPETN